MSRLDRDGTHLYYEVHGSGPAILLTHGFSATSGMWKPQVEALSKNHTLVLWDLRGHGQSDSPENPGDYDEATTVADIGALLDAAGFERAVIGGLSLGGYISLAFALDHPERVAGLVIADTGPGYKRDDKREEWNEMANRLANRIARKGHEALQRGGPEMRQSTHRDPRGVEMAARHTLTQHSPRVIEGLSSIRAPALAVVGANDELYLGPTDYMAKKIPNATKVVIPNAGHAVNIDQPEAFDRAVLDFLAANGLENA